LQHPLDLRRVYGDRRRAAIPSSFSAMRPLKEWPIKIGGTGPGQRRSFSTSTRLLSLLSLLA
jgi:hypothetical protein